MKISDMQSAFSSLFWGANNLPILKRSSAPTAEWRQFEPPTDNKPVRQLGRPAKLIARQGDPEGARRAAPSNLSRGATESRSCIITLRFFRTTRPFRIQTLDAVRFSPRHRNVAAARRAATSAILTDIFSRSDRTQTSRTINARPAKSIPMVLSGLSGTQRSKTRQFFPRPLPT